MALRSPALWFALCLVLSPGPLALACSSDAEVVQKDGTGGKPADSGIDVLACSAGQFVCSGDVAKPCLGGGKVGDPVDCAASSKICVDFFGCVTCAPTSQSCANGTAKICKNDGSAWETFECDATQGMKCETSGCTGSCTPPSLKYSYLGCDYFPTVTLNPVWSGFEFAVAVANAGKSAASVVVTRGTTEVKKTSVAAGALEVLSLPWVPELKGGDVDACQLPPDPGATRVVKGGAYRLRTDQPVTVYQLSPLRYEIKPAPAECPVGAKCPGGFGSDCLAFSNDATLLLPSTTLTGNYTSVAWPSAPNRAGFVAVTATQDGTEVQLFGKGEFAAGAGIDTSGNGKVTLARGDVLEVIARHDGPSGQYGADISGTRLKASKPVQVIGGHSCANIPTAATDACDHIEHAMLPVETLGKEYYVAFPAALASQSPHVVRIVAIEPNTKLTFDPASVSGDKTLSPTDAPLELSGVTEDFKVSGDKAFMVAQFMQGQASVPSGSGDPSLGLAVPAAQYRKDYLFITSATYDTSFVNVITKSGASVSLDGAPLSGTPSLIGASGYAVTRVELPAGLEVHRIESGSPFGIMVYGYGRYTSYMYAGGLDLTPITIPPVF
ncbi:MAG: IgGFc-binding protein [Myxococcales bacterium]|nr:IgGFc-binding protein [Myxococcales bacterium]